MAPLQLCCTTIVSVIENGIKAARGHDSDPSSSNNKQICVQGPPAHFVWPQYIILLCQPPTFPNTKLLQYTVYLQYTYSARSIYNIQFPPQVPWTKWSIEYPRLKLVMSLLENYSRPRPGWGRAGGGAGGGAEVGVDRDVAGHVASTEPLHRVQYPHLIIRYHHYTIIYHLSW